jgi:predicted alpha/beta hydrolase
MANEADPLITHYSVVDAKQHLLWLPALGTPAKFYRPLAILLQTHGVAISVLEWRGEGESPLIPSRECDFGIDDILSDACKSYRALVAMHPDREVLVCGHSLGGHIAILLAASIGLPARLLLVAQGMPFWRFYQGVLRYKILLLAAIIKLITPVIGYFPGHRVGFAGREARQLMNDWCRWALRGRYETKYSVPLASYDGHILAIDIEGDQITPANVAIRTQEYLPRAKHTREVLRFPYLQHNHHHAWAKAGQVETVVNTLVNFIKTEQS